MVHFSDICFNNGHFGVERASWVDNGTLSRERNSNMSAPKKGKQTRSHHSQIAAMMPDEMAVAMKATQASSLLEWAALYAPQQQRGQLLRRGAHGDAMGARVSDVLQTLLQRAYVSSSALSRLASCVRVG